MALDKKLITNVLHNSYSAIVPLLVAVITVPLYIKTIGLERYGVLSVIWLVFGYFGLFDFGLSRATTHAMAKYGKSSSQLKEDIFRTALSINTLLGIVAGLAFLLAATPIIQVVLHKSSSIVAETAQALPLVALLFPFALVSNVMSGRLEAEEKFPVLNTIQLVGSILLQILPLVFALMFRINLISAIGGAIAARIITIALLANTVRKELTPDIRPHFVWAEGKKLLQFGGWLTITNAISPLLVSADQLLIGYLLGAKMLPYYSIPFNFSMKGLLIPEALTRALFPRLSGLETGEAKHLAEQSLSILAGVMALVCAPAIIIIKSVLTLWMGARFAEGAYPVTALLLLGLWINAIAYIPSSHLQSQGRADLVAKYHAIELLPFIALLYLGITQFGLIGAAMAWCLRVTTDALLLFHADSTNKLDYSPIYTYFFITLMAVVISLFVQPNLFAQIAIVIVGGAIIALKLYKQVQAYRHSLLLNPAINPMSNY